MTPDELVQFLRETEANPPPDAHDQDVADKAWQDRTWMCMMLATTVEACEALLRGDEVAADVLDQTWLRRFRKQGLL